VEAAISGLLIKYQNIKYAIFISVMLNNNSCIVKVNDAKQDKDDLYCFMRPAAQPSAHYPISKELGDFLQSKASSVQSLPDYHMITSAFVKANSTLPSSAAVKHLMHKWDDIVSIKVQDDGQAVR